MKAFFHSRADTAWQWLGTFLISVIIAGPDIVAHLTHSATGISRGAISCCNVGSCCGHFLIQIWMVTITFIFHTDNWKALYRNKNACCFLSSYFSISGGTQFLGCTQLLLLWVLLAISQDSGSISALSHRSNGQTISHCRPGWNRSKGKIFLPCSVFHTERKTRAQVLPTKLWSTDITEYHRA